MASKFSFQRMLWNIAGAEIPILEKCRTDHKRFGAVGATIAMTSFIAFLSGTSAAWYFTQRGSDTSGNIGWAMAFGVVWATLIFCIDRSLVITLKKNPERKSKFWWAVPLVSRAMLAGIIAFMVSIPLELVVFEDFIAEQEFIWKENKSNSLSENSRANRASEEAQRHIEENDKNIKRFESQKTQLDNEKSSLENERNIQRGKLNNPTTQAYKDARAGFNSANSSMNSLQGRLNSLQRQLDEANQWNKSSIQSQINSVRSQLNAQRSKKASCQNTMKAEVDKWNKPINERIAELDEQIAAKEEEISKKINVIDETQKQNLVTQARRDSLVLQRDSLVDEHDVIMQKGNHFIQNFEILEYAVSPKDLDCTFCGGAGMSDKAQCSHCFGKGKVKSERPNEWYFLWLIRLLFFIIELLPTVVKIVMPLGAYDKMVYSEEKDMEEYLTSPNYLDRIRKMHDMEIKAHEEQLEDQKSLEAEIRLKIMQDLKEAQLEIAEAAVKQWRETELARIKSEGLKMVSAAVSETPVTETKPKLYSVDIEDGVKRTEYPT